MVGMVLLGGTLQWVLEVNLKVIDIVLSTIVSVKSNLLVFNWEKDLKQQKYEI